MGEMNIKFLKHICEFCYNEMDAPEIEIVFDRDDNPHWICFECYEKIKESFKNSLKEEL